MNYYYLVASLPKISLEAPPPMDVVRFRSLCAEHLNAADLRDLDEVLSPSGKARAGRFAAEWAEFDTMLRNSIAKTRAARLKKDPSVYTRKTKNYDTVIDKAVSDAYTKSTPLDRELAIDRFRCEQADEMAGLNPFLGRAVMAYAIKLLLAARWAEMSQETGSSRAEDLISSARSAKEENQEQ